MATAAKKTVWKPPPKNKFETAIFVMVKRYDDTYFILCDEYETVNTLKGRVLQILQQMNFKMPKMEEELTTDDIRLTIKNRILDPDSTCHDQQVFNDTVVYCLIKKSEQKDDFEDLEKVSG